MKLLRRRDLSGKPEIVAAALCILIERGPASLRIRHVAEAANVSTMAIYKHFGSKDGIVEGLAVHGFESLRDALAAVPRTTNARSDLMALSRAYRGFALENPGLFGIMFERAIPEYVPGLAARSAAVSASAVLRDRIRAWGGAPRPAELAHIMLCAAHGLVSAELASRRAGDAPDLIDDRSAEDVYEKAMRSLIF